MSLLKNTFSIKQIIYIQISLKTVDYGNLVPSLKKFKTENWGKLLFKFLICKNGDC